MSKVKLNDGLSKRKIELWNQGKFLYKNKQKEEIEVEIPFSNEIIDINLKPDETKDFISFFKNIKRSLSNSKNELIWDEYQTPIKNQKNRNTCSVFAFVAAIEARYKRDYGLELDLSEQYCWHLYKSVGFAYPRRYLYESSSSYFDGGNAREIQKLANFVIPLEKYCLYLDRDEMKKLRDSIPNTGTLTWKKDPAQNTITQDQIDRFERSFKYIPIKAIQNAKYGVEEYQKLGNETCRSPEKIEQLLCNNFDIIINYKPNWRRDEAGVFRYKNLNRKFHVSLIVGYNRTEKFFYVKNSWGENGLLKVDYEVFEKTAAGGSIVKKVRDPEKPILKGNFIGIWLMNHDGQNGKLIIRRYTYTHNSITRLGHYITPNGTRKAVNGKFHNNGRTVEFYIIDQEYPSPTETNGQKFIIHQYSWDVRHCGGYTVFYGKKYGCFLRRVDYMETYGADYTIYKWIGIWNMNHDGWKGRLHLENINKTNNTYYITGKYYTNQNQRKEVTGEFNSLSSKILSLTIRFSQQNNQDFKLYFYSSDDNVFAGTTVWNDEDFGVFGERI